MLLYAKDKDDRLVFADTAKKQESYNCLECGSSLRLRGGLHRRKHFYHIEESRSCKLQGKSITHLQVQCFIKKLLPQAEVFLEKYFSKISRIADVCWENQKIIFEVQCSPISQEEILARNSDYESLGYRVVWIFHTHRYGKKILTSAENVLKDKAFYYTDIDIYGRGAIYDKIYLLNDIFPVNLSKVFYTKQQNIYFEGDVKDLFIQNKLSEKQKKYFLKQKSKSRLFWKRFKKKIVNGYLLFFRIFIESICKN